MCDGFGLEFEVAEAVDCFLLLPVDYVEVFFGHFDARMSHQGGYGLDVGASSEHVYGEAVAGAVPSYFFVYPGYFHPFLEAVVGSAFVAGDFEYCFRTSAGSRRFAYEPEQCGAKRYCHSAVGTAAFGLFLVEAQQAGGVVDVAVCEPYEVAPAHTCEAAEQEGALHGCVLGFVPRGGEFFYLGECEYFFFKCVGVALYYYALARVFLHNTVLDGVEYYRAEHIVRFVGAFSLSDFLEIVREPGDHFGSNQFHSEHGGMRLVSRRGLEEAEQTVVGCSERRADGFGVQLVVAVASEVLEEVALGFFSEAVPLAVFEKFLLALEAYFFGEFECGFVPGAFLPVARGGEYVQVESLAFA